jgi:D-xylose transport system permease protein
MAAASARLSALESVRLARIHSRSAPAEKAAAVIGGTSLFGGRGRVISALMGALVIATVANGIDLLGYKSSVKYMVTGLILLAAVTLDTITRRRLERSGR